MSVGRLCRAGVYLCLNSTKVAIHVPAGITRGLKNSLCAVFTRYLRGNHVRYIYGNILKYTVNTGDSVFFFGGGGSSCLQVSCVVRLPFFVFGGVLTKLIGVLKARA